MPLVTLKREGSRRSSFRSGDTFRKRRFTKVTIVAIISLIWTDHNGAIQYGRPIFLISQTEMTPKKRRRGQQISPAGRDLNIGDLQPFLCRT